MLLSPLGPGVSQMARALIRADAMNFFVDNLEDMASFWTELLDSTCLPRNNFCADAGITSALRSLDKILSAENSTPLAQRLAFVQLPRVLDAATSISASNKWRNTLEIAVTGLDSSIDLDMYSKAQGKESRSARKELNLRKRLAQRWIDLSASHPLLLVTYTAEAEHIM